MKRILASVAFALMIAAPAQADTLAGQVGTEAARLLVQVKMVEATARASARPAKLEPAMIADLQRFGLAASRLSVEIERTGGPSDLRCIFRGMAAETDTQLKAASSAATGAAQAHALSRINHLLSDAVLIAPAVNGQAQTRAAANAKSAAAQQCQIDRNF